MNSKNNHQLTYTEEFLAEFAQREKDAIETRKTVSNILLTIGCQFTNSALALIMLQFSVNLLIISLVNWICIFIPLIPEAGNISLSLEGGFRITGIKKPGTIIFKFGCGTIMSVVVFRTITTTKNETKEAIKASLQEIKQYENPPMIDTNQPVIVGAFGFISAIVLFSVLTSFFTRHKI